MLGRGGDAEETQAGAGAGEHEAIGGPDEEEPEEAGPAKPAHNRRAPTKVC